MPRAASWIFCCLSLVANASSATASPPDVRAGTADHTDLSGSSSRALPPPPGMLRIPGARVELGSTYAELIEAAEWCNRLTQSSHCRAEDFRDELSLGTRSTIPDFFLDRTETTIGEYERCVRAGSCRPSSMEDIIPGISREEELPVTMVGHQDAAAYCAFRGARLPTEEESEFAARGSARRRFPWGDLFHAGRTNGGASLLERTNQEDGYELLAPALAFRDGRSPEGVLQLAGNAAEWTATREVDASGGPGERYVVRGGHFATPPWLLRSAHRETLPPHVRRITVGFRCAKSATLDTPPERQLQSGSAR